MDFEIAKGMGLTLEKVREKAAELSAAHEIIVCKLIRYEGSKKVEGWLCRLSGYIPPAAPGRKPKGSVAR